MTLASEARAEEAAYAISAQVRSITRQRFATPFFLFDGSHMFLPRWLK